MTAPDVRTAAQAEAEARDVGDPDDHSLAPAFAELRREGFTDGAVWGSALVTPTWERIARAIALTDDYDGCFERIDEWEALEEWEREAQPQEAPLAEYEDAGFWVRRADAVLALISGLVEEAIPADSSSDP